MTTLSKKILTWKIIKSMVLFLINRLSPLCAKLKGYYQFQENYDKFVREKQLIKSQVLNGPFKGLRYPAFASVGSALLPKLLGSYEYEIASLVDDLCSQPYSAVVDIGCAEGYYAVGFAMRLPKARVYAFDPNPKARRLCQQMARLNQAVVICGNFCSRETLINLDLGQHALIISDCEGYELQLFDSSTMQLLQNHDLLIETHDNINMACSDIMLKNLSLTHQVIAYESLDDFAKARQYQFKELESLSLTERFQLMRECRDTPQKWLFAKSKLS
jgi:precorrin-6B methylase 2